VKKSLQKSKLILNLLGFLFALQVAMPTFINSSFIDLRLPSKNLIGLLYALGSFVAIFLLLKLPRILKYFGNYNLTLFLTALHIVGLCVLAFSNTTPLILLMFLVGLIVNTIIFLNLDIFLEKYSVNVSTGNTRASFMTAINSAWVLAPFIAGYILTNGDYWKIYLTAIFILIPFLILLHFNFKNFKDTRYIATPFKGAIEKIKRNKNIKNIFVVKTFLSFFYSWMVIYTPIYLHQYMGMTWSAIGIVFTIMLLPFVIFAVPLGKLADKKYGEKEILVVGILILSAFTIALSFINNNIIWVWAVLLFMTRVGATAIEVATESYFFKKINSKDTDIISIFRIANPLAYIIGPVVASLIFIFVDFKYIFLVLGALMPLSLKYALQIKDTK